jgi:hypothetical protein
MGRHQKLPPMTGGVARMIRSQSNDLGGSRMNSIASYEEQDATPKPRKSKYKMNVGGDPGAGEDEEEEEEAKRKKN